MLKSIELSNPRKAQTQQKQKRQPLSHSLFFFFFFIVSGRNCRFLAGATKKNAANLLFFIVSSKNCRFPAEIAGFRPLFSRYSALYTI
ncbi:hypothetical protein Hanom_Chr09g00788331 [Helianthus anomalus]